MGRWERLRWVVWSTFITLILWLLLGRGSMVLLPAFVVALAVIIGILLARGAKPKHRLWLSRHGFAMWFGGGPGKLEAWPTGTLVTFQAAAADMVTIRVLIEGGDRLMLPLITVQLNEDQRAEVERRVQGWMLSTKKTMGQ
jgi:hypothetical protein